MLVWEELPAISFKVSESFKAFKNWHPSHLVSLCLLPISLLLFSGSGKLNWLGWNFLSVLPCQAQGWEQNKSSGSATAVFCFHCWAEQDAEEFKMRLSALVTNLLRLWDCFPWQVLHRFKHWHHITCLPWNRLRFHTAPSSTPSL